MANDRIKLYTCQIGVLYSNSFKLMNWWILLHLLNIIKNIAINGFFFPVNSKISAHEFERGGLLKPIVNTIDGTPTFLSVCPQSDSALCSASSNIGSTNNNSHRPQRLSRNELRHLDEKQLIFELVRYRMLLFNYTNSQINTHTHSSFSKNTFTIVIFFSISIV